MAAPTQSEPIQSIKSPWKLKGTIYSFMTYLCSKDTMELVKVPSFMYSKLEAKSEFADGNFTGGLGMVQIIRYTESPCGPYDEMLVVPGFFEYQNESVGADTRVKIHTKKHARITKIFVSQKETCYNGRKNWNIPKHLAQFTFAKLPDKKISIKVSVIEDVTGAISTSATPYFSATFAPIQYLPSFPFTSKIAPYVGLDITLVQPPLPEGMSSYGELPGTNKWCGISPYQYSNKTSIGWWDMRQNETLKSMAAGCKGKNDKEHTYENWWPGAGRWRIGMVMENAEIEFPEGRYWTRSSL